MKDSLVVPLGLGDMGGFTIMVANQEYVTRERVDFEHGKWEPMQIYQAATSIDLLQLMQPQSVSS